MHSHASSSPRPRLGNRHDQCCCRACAPRRQGPSLSDTRNQHGVHQDRPAARIRAVREACRSTVESGDAIEPGVTADGNHPPPNATLSGTMNAKRRSTNSPPDGLPTYRLLTGPDDAAFCHRVSEALALGYELYGSPAATFNGKEVIVAQAVIWPSSQRTVVRSKR